MPTTYTPASMESQTVEERRPSVAAAPLAEAREILVQAAEAITSLAHRVRQTHSEESQSGRAADGDAALVGQAIARLDGAARDLTDTMRFLDQGSHARPGGPAARQILEAQEQERSRLAEELHDGPAQALSNAGFQVEIIDRAMRSDPAAARRELAELRSLLERELERMRGFIHQLRPALDEPGGLSAAMEELVEAIGSESAMRIALELDAPEEWLDLTARTAVLRVTQEALRNARKHARANMVTVRTQLELDGDGATPREWILEVMDDGRGFPPDQPTDRSPRRHFGLRFMRERAQLAGGDLSIETSAGEGTTVRLVIDPRERS